jgi:hypothetical protein
MRSRVAPLLVQLPHNHGWHEQNDTRQAEDLRPVRLVEESPRFLEERSIAYTPDLSCICRRCSYPSNELGCPVDESVAIDTGARQGVSSELREGLGNMELAHRRRLLDRSKHVYFGQQRSVVDTFAGAQQIYPWSMLPRAVDQLVSLRLRPDRWISDYPRQYRVTWRNIGKRNHGLLDPEGVALPDSLLDRSNGFSGTAVVRQRLRYKPARLAAFSAIVWTNPLRWGFGDGIHQDPRRRAARRAGGWATGA